MFHSSGFLTSILFENSHKDGLRVRTFRCLILYGYHVTHSMSTLKLTVASAIHWMWSNRAAAKNILSKATMLRKENCDGH